jgi:hypothetical protein
MGIDLSGESQQDGCGIIRLCVLGGADLMGQRLVEGTRGIPGKAAHTKRMSDPFWSHLDHTPEGGVGLKRD